MGTRMATLGVVTLQCRSAITAATKQSIRRPHCTTYADLTRITISLVHWPAMFTAWDYAAFAAMLLISTGIGLYFGCTGGRQRTTREYMLADRSMGLLPVSLSQLSSFMSAITVLGVPAEMYVFGSQYWMVWVGYAIAMPTAAYVFIPVFYNLRITSVFEVSYLTPFLHVLSRLC